MAEGRSNSSNPEQLKGWLLKWTNYIKGYQRRWFVLSNGLLSYYRTQEEMSHTCRGTVNLIGAFIDSVDTTHFVISNGQSQVYHLRAANAVEKQNWVTMLELSKAKAIKSMESGRYQANKIESPVVNGLLVAARKGLTQVVLEALAKRGGAHPPQDTVDRHGRNCLQLASLYGHYETALVILQSNKLDINTTNKRGLTALHDACTEGHTRLALLLLSMGASVKAITKDGWSCLMCACSNGHLQLASILIAIGCEMNATTSIGLSALHIAAWKGQSAALAMLIRGGANVMAESNNGKTALDLSQEEKQSGCVDILQAAVSKESENLELRLSALEGQLGNAQEELSKTKAQYEQILEREREMNKAALVKLEKSKDEELEKSKQKLKTLDEKVSELQALLKRSINSPPLLMETVPTPPPTKVKKIKNKDISAVVKSAATRSTSFTDLVSIQDNTSPKTSKKELSPQKLAPQKKRSIDSSCAEKRISVERRSITDLVAESLLNPGNMAAIRQELKADNLTPKIQRKLKNQTNHQATTLPSLSNGSSPTHHNDTVPQSSISPKGSPTTTRPRWTNPRLSLKDSAI